MKNYFARCLNIPIDILVHVSQYIRIYSFIVAPEIAAIDYTSFQLIACHTDSNAFSPSKGSSSD